MLNKLLSLCTEPPANPVRRITAYYVFLAAAVALAIWLWPSLLPYVRGNAANLPATTFGGPPVIVTPSNFHIEISLIVSMLGAVLLMLPVSWGYMGARRFTGFDQSVVQTIVILPMAVAGIVVMVKNSVALAFSLAGVVAGVRFRSSLSDTADALYIFVAIGVGLAAGIGELGVGAVISIFLNYVILSLWKCDYGTCPISGPKSGWSAGASNKKKPKRKKKHAIANAPGADKSGSTTEVASKSNPTVNGLFLAAEENCGD